MKILIFTITLSLGLQAFAMSQSEVSALMTEAEYHPQMIGIAAMANKMRNTYSRGECWKRVYFNQLVPLGIADKARDNPGRKYQKLAKNADIELGSFGFVNLMAPGQPLNGITNLCLAPAGAILIYNSNTGRSCGTCGHTETKISPVGGGEVSSDFRSPTPVTGSCATSGRGYTLKAIMVPKVVADYLVRFTNEKNNADVAEKSRQSAIRHSSEPDINRTRTADDVEIVN